MAKPAKNAYVCQSCGSVETRWAGKCPGCGEWNTLVEEVSPAVAAIPGSGLAKTRKGRRVTLEALQGQAQEAPRFSTGFVELDRVTGGGIVPGSALLIGGEPGIGKSTILLQLAVAVANAGRRAIYFTGEEASAQVRLRAERLGLSDAPVALAAETNLANILETIAGVLLVGHVTKDGQIAGPKVIEHMVDTVLYFEGDRGHPYRILRAVKNRFGATDEIGVFEMAGAGLREVQNPSELFLGDRDSASPGAAVFAGMEGTRPILVEIQALVAPSSLGTPRRAVVGWDSNRLSMLLAVLEARCGLSFAQADVYLNVAGGLKITEPAADVAAAAALLSSFCGVALPPDHVYFGEISLSGAVRAAAHTTARLKEAQKLGFKTAVTPAAGEIDGATLTLEIDRIDHLKSLAESLTP